MGVFNFTQVFAEHADGNLSIWKKTIGCRVNNASYGVGKITRVERTKHIYITVTFETLPTFENEKRFTESSFSSGYFTDVDMIVRFEGTNMSRESLLDKIEEQKQKNATEREIAKYRKMYSIKDDYNFKPELYNLLKEMGECKYISDDILLWAEGEKLDTVVARIYELQYKNTKDLWKLIRACKYWRQVGRPDRVIKITEGIKTDDKKKMVAIYNTRGAAFRDMRKFAKAKFLAIKAYVLEPNNYYVCNLLAAIYFQEGNPHKGDEYLKKVEILSADSSLTKKTVKDAYRNADPQRKRELLDYYSKSNIEKYNLIKDLR